MLREEKSPRERLRTTVGFLLTARKEERKPVRHSPAPSAPSGTLSDWAPISAHPASIPPPFQALARGVSCRPKEEAASRPPPLRKAATSPAGVPLVSGKSRSPRPLPNSGSSRQRNLQLSPRASVLRCLLTAKSREGSHDVTADTSAPRAPAADLLARDCRVLRRSLELLLVF